MSFPYIGITDFTHFSQVERMVDSFKKHSKPHQKHRLHVGVMMSYKTLHHFETKWTQAFPPNESVASLFQSPNTLNCLHYADYEGVDVAESLIQAIAFGGDGMNALQLDMVWPNPEDLMYALNATKPLNVILQIGDNAFKYVEHNPKKMVAKLAQYEPIITHILLDKSMGQGKLIDVVSLTPYIHAIKDAFPHINIAVAGGLGPDTVHVVASLFEMFSDISIDAQSRLRPSGNALNPIDWDMAETYLIKALEMVYG